MGVGRGIVVGIKNFTFQSGYIQMACKRHKREEVTGLYIPIWLYSNYFIAKLFQNSLYFTFQSGYIQIITRRK